MIARAGWKGAGEEVFWRVGHIDHTSSGLSSFGSFVFLAPVCGYVRMMAGAAGRGGRGRVCKAGSSFGNFVFFGLLTHSRIALRIS
jgi:hypothetical protein